MNFFLFEHARISLQLQPFTLTRPVAHIRIGIFTMADRWRKYLNSEVFVCCHGLLEKQFPFPENKEGIWINSAWIPDEAEAERTAALLPGEALFKGEVLLACHQDSGSGFSYSQNPTGFRMVRSLDDAFLLTRPWEIFAHNGVVIRNDFEQIRKGRLSAPLTDPHTVVYGKENLFIEEGVDVKAAVINALEGPVYLGLNSQIQEGALIKGPFALLENSVVNMGAKIRPDTTVGPFCKVGGEISNAVFFGYSNKAHDGFLGNSVIGEWCNLGADTNNSNLKNNYAEVKVWSYAEEEMVPTGLQFCGLLMGDHSKAGINTMFNTGTVVGPACNLFDSSFPPRYIPGFTWGGATSGFEIYRLEKFLEAEARVFARRNKQMPEEYVNLLRHLFVRSVDEPRP